MSRDDPSVPGFVQPDPSVPGFVSAPSPPGRVPARPKDWRWFVGGLGRILIALGVLILGFVAYQLWGTGIQEARSQQALGSEFEHLLGLVPDSSAPPATVPGASTVPGATTIPSDTTLPSDNTAPSDNTTPSTAPPGSTGPASPPSTAADGRVLRFSGDAVARLEIPKISVDKIVVAGVNLNDLKQGPGHYPGTPLPGEPGNAAIAGHRTTYGAPFGRINELSAGDEIVATTPGGRYVYKVTNTEIVSPTDTSVLAPTTQDQLTLTSCHPRFSTRQRIIVRALLDPTQSDPVGPAPIVIAPQVVADSNGSMTSIPGDSTDQGAGSDNPTVAPALTGPGNSSTPPSTTPGSTETTAGATGGATTTPTTTTASASNPPTDQASFQAGWFSDPDAWPHVAAWGLGLAAIAVLAWQLSRRVHRDWVGALVGLVPFLVALYFFYENVARLLPPNL